MRWVEQCVAYFQRVIAFDTDRISYFHFFTVLSMFEHTKSMFFFIMYNNSCKSPLKNSRCDDENDRWYLQKKEYTLVTARKYWHYFNCYEIIKLQQSPYYLSNTHNLVIKLIVFVLSKVQFEYYSPHLYSELFSSLLLHWILMLVHLVYWIFALFVCSFCLKLHGKIM